MKNLDDNLRDALRREEPPEGFAERVLRRVARGAEHSTDVAGSRGTRLQPAGR